MERKTHLDNKNNYDFDISGRILISQFSIHWRYHNKRKHKQVKDDVYIQQNQWSLY